MDSGRDLTLALKSDTPIVVIESVDEPQLLNLLVNEALNAGADGYMPLFRWSITDGLQRLDIDLEEQTESLEPEQALRAIRASRKNGVYVLLDFHPYLQDPLHVRLLKDLPSTVRKTDARLSY